jgi:hypothetical protein
MAEQGYTQTVSTADFTETPSLAFEQPTGDVYVESWDRPEIQVSIKDDGYFEIEQKGSRIEVKNRPGRFKLVDFLEQGEDLRNLGEDLRNFGIDIDRMASHVERSVGRNVERRMKKMGRNINVEVDVTKWRGGQDYKIMVPQNCDLTLRTSSGDMTIVGVNGTLFLQSASGDLHARQVSGNALIRTSSGDIEIDELRGKLAVQTASGDLTARNLGLSELSASTASGDLELELTGLPEGNVEVRTVSGDLDLYLPSDSAFRAEVHTLSGSLRCGFPREVVDYTASHRRETILNVNGGGKSIQFNTVSGDVSIRPRKANSAGAQTQSQGASQSGNPGPGASYGSPTVRTGGEPTMDLSRTQSPAQSAESSDTDPSQGDITQSEGYAARKQAELEILQQVERGDLSPEDAIERLAQLDNR